MKITVVKAEESNIKQSIELSKRSVVVKGPDGSIVKPGIFKPISVDDLPHLFVALDENKNVVGVLKTKIMSKKCEFDWFEAPRANKAVIVGSICVDENMRGQHIASRMLDFVKKNLPQCILYAEIMVKPIRNEASLAMAYANGFVEYLNGKVKKWQDGCDYTFFKFESI